MADISMTRFGGSLSLAPQPPRPAGAARYRGSEGRYVGIAVVLLLHLGAISALVAALDTRVAALVRQPVQISVIEQQKPKDETRPPPPPPEFAPPPPYIPPPDIRIEQAAPVQSTAIQVVTHDQPPAPPPAAAPAAPEVKIPPTLDTASSRDPDYPPQARRMGEEGLVSLLVMVEPDGSVSEVKVEKSSGHPALDDAAVTGARRHCRFKPGTVDGKPVRGWYRYRYNFSLT